MRILSKKYRKEVLVYKHPDPCNGNAFPTDGHWRNRHGKCVRWTPAQIAALNAQLNAQRS